MASDAKADWDRACVQSYSCHESAVLDLRKAGDAMASELAAARERIAVLSEALKPFATGCLLRVDGPQLCDGPADPECCRYCAARAALGEKK